MKGRDMLKDEQIVATVPTLELANTLRVRLMRRVRENGTRLTIFVFHDSTVPDEYHIGIASEWQTKVSDDTVLDTMEFITDFQEEQLRAEAESYALPPLDELTRGIIGEPPYADILPEEDEFLNQILAEDEEVKKRSTIDE